MCSSDLISGVLEDRAGISNGLPADKVLVIAPDRDSAAAETTAAMFPTVDAYETVGTQYGCGGKWENYVTAQTQLHMLDFEAQAMIHRVSPTPFLMVVPGNDVLVKTSSQLAAFGKAKEPKKLFYIDGAGHFDIYTDDVFEKNIQAQLDFLQDHVMSS